MLEVALHAGMTRATRNSFSIRDCSEMSSLRWDRTRYVGFLAMRLRLPVLDVTSNFVRFLPACPPSGDGCTFPYTVLTQDDQKASCRSTVVGMEQRLSPAAHLAGEDARSGCICFGRPSAQPAWILKRWYEVQRTCGALTQGAKQATLKGY